MVYGIVSAMNGDIKVQSRTEAVGHGPHCRVFLPRLLAPHSAGDPPKCGSSVFIRVIVHEGPSASRETPGKGVNYHRTEHTKEREQNYRFEDVYRRHGGVPGKD